MKPLALALAIVAVMSVSGLAAAQITQQSPSREVKTSSEDFVTSGEHEPYSVTFLDDPLAAALNDGNVPRIQVRATRGYGQLSRPRLQFVREMVKSVEVL